MEQENLTNMNTTTISAVDSLRFAVKDAAKKDSTLAVVPVSMACAAADEIERLQYERDVWRSKCEMLAKARSASEPPDDDRLAERGQLLFAVSDWISSAPHGDNCFVTDEYPGNQCVCGKDALVRAMDDEFGVDESSVTKSASSQGILDTSPDEREDPCHPAFVATLADETGESRWIDGRPPKDDGTYLVANSAGQVAPYIRGIIHNNAGTAHDWHFGEAITKWMRLPSSEGEGR